jgi:hypothetical protein
VTHLEVLEDEFEGIVHLGVAEVGVVQGLAQLARRVRGGAGAEEQHGEHVVDGVRREKDVLAAAGRLHQVPVQVQRELKVRARQALHVGAVRQARVHQQHGGAHHAAPTHRAARSHRSPPETRNSNNWYSHSAFTRKIKVV